MIDFKPFDYQETMIDHVENTPECILFCGMGVGKSSSTLKAFSHLRFRGKARAMLIVSPLRVTNLTWHMEALKWKFSSRYKVVNLRSAVKYSSWLRKKSIAEKNGKKPPSLSKKDQQKGSDALNTWVNKEGDVYLINYELLQQFTDELIKPFDEIHPDMVVFDELSKTKAPSSKRIQHFRKYMYHFQRKVGLTGSLLSNGYIDLFAQVRLIDGGKTLGKYITHYKSEYFYNPDRQGFTWTLRKGSKEAIEQKISHLTLTMRSEDHLDIPDVVYHDVEVKIPHNGMKAYYKLEKELLVELEGGDIPAVSAAALTNKLLQMSSGSVYDEDGEVRFLHDEKIKALSKLIKKIEGNVLIACSFKHEKARLLEAFPEAQEFKEKDLGKWNNGEIPVWIADYRSISHGLNLQEGGNNIVWFSPTYSFESYEQFNARLARTGQEHQTNIYRLIASDTIDEAVVEVLRQKEQGQNSLKEALKVLEFMRRI